jgi:hypothetical protein
LPSVLHQLHNSMFICFGQSNLHFKLRSSSLKGNTDDMAVSNKRSCSSIGFFVRLFWKGSLYQCIRLHPIHLELFEYGVCFYLRLIQYAIYWQIFYRTENCNSIYKLLVFKAHYHSWDGNPIDVSSLM